MSNEKKYGANISNIDRYLCGFCDDSINVLQEYDVKIRNKILSGKDKSFYMHDIKGIAVWSITEPIIKYLIYTSLLDKYKMLPERALYGDKKLLDLALYYKDIDESVIADLYTEWDPDIAIEMKWAGIRKDGNLYGGWQNKIKLDIEKLNKIKKIDNKYLMLFIIIDDVTKKIEPSKLIDSLYSSLDKRKFRNKHIEFIYSNYFPTIGSCIQDEWRFYIQLYKIV